jgi:hypothetical protein
MNTKTKNWIRAAVLAAVLAWPAVETCRYYAARQQLAASLQQQNAVQIELARLKSAQVAGQPASPARP